MAASLRERYPKFRLVARESSLLDKLLQRGMTMTLGSTVYMPAALMDDPVSGVRILRHEAVHIEQFRRHPVWFPLSYLLLAPFGITMRARWEFEGYIETMRDELESTGTIADSTLDWIERLFTGPAYFYMDVRRRRVRTNLEDARRRLMAGNVGTGG